MRSSKTATTVGGAVRALSNNTAQPPSAAYTSQISSFIDKWKSFESTMATARAMKEGPLRWLPPDNKDGDYISPSPAQIYSQRSESNKQMTVASDKPPDKGVEIMKKEKEIEEKSKLIEEQNKQERLRLRAQAAMNQKVGRLNDQMFILTLKEMEKRQKDNMSKMSASSPGQEHPIDPRGTYDPKKWSAPNWKDGVMEDGTVANKVAQADEHSSMSEDLQKSLNENDAFVAAAEQELMIKKNEKDKMDLALDEMEKRRESKESIMTPGRIEWNRIDPLKIFDATKL